MKKSNLFSLLILFSVLCFGVISCNPTDLPISIGTAITDESFDNSTCYLTFNCDVQDGTVGKVKIDQDEIKTEALSGKLKFDLREYLAENVLGGTEVKAVLSTENNVFTKEFSFKYLPDFQISSTEVSQRIVFYSNIPNLQLPVVKTNYIDEYVSKEITFGVQLGDDDENFTKKSSLEDIKNFLADPANDGKKAIINYFISLKSDESTLKHVYFTYTGKPDTKIQRITISYGFNADIYTNVWADDDCTEAAGGEINYEWSRSPTGDDGTWTPIADSNSPNYYFTEADIDNYLKLTATQICTDEYDNPVDVTIDIETCLLKGVLSGADLKYTEEVQEGSTLDESKFQLSNLKELFGNQIIQPGNDGASTFILMKINNVNGFETPVSIDCDTIDESEEITVGIYSENYLPISKTIYITVKSKLEDSELPELSKDVENISEGNVRFAANKYNLEFYDESSAKWNTVLSSTEIKASSGSTIKIRKVAEGEQGTIGFVDYSDTKLITVKTENIGRKLEDLSSKKITVFNGDITVTVEEVDDNIFEISAAPVYPLDKNNFSYKWQIDTSITTGISYSSDHSELTIDASNWPRDTYNVLVTATDITDLPEELVELGMVSGTTYATQACFTVEDKE